MSEEIQFEGIETLLRRLEELGGNTEEALKLTLRTQTEIVRAEAIKLAPVYSGPWDFVPSGELRNSIHTSVRNLSGEMTGIVYTNLEYAPYVEYGTGPMGQEHHEGIDPEIPVTYRQEPWVWQDPDGGYHYTKGQPAQPFMYPALKNNTNRIIKNIQRDLTREIDKIAGGNND